MRAVLVAPTVDRSTRSGFWFGWGPIAPNLLEGIGGLSHLRENWRANFAAALKNVNCCLQAPRHFDRNDIAQVISKAGACLKHGFFAGECLSFSR
jgi:hypothetical protein